MPIGHLEQPCITWKSPIAAKALNGANALKANRIAGAGTIIVVSVDGFFCCCEIATSFQACGKVFP